MLKAVNPSFASMVNIAHGLYAICLEHARYYKFTFAELGMSLRSLRACAVTNTSKRFIYVAWLRSSGCDVVIRDRQALAQDAPDGIVSVDSQLSDSSRSEIVTAGSSTRGIGCMLSPSRRICKKH